MGVKFKLVWKEWRTILFKQIHFPCLKTESPSNPGFHDHHAGSWFFYLWSPNFGVVKLLRLRRLLWSVKIAMIRYSILRSAKLFSNPSTKTITLHYCNASAGALLPTYTTGITAYNSLLRRKSQLLTKNADVVSWYVCGPTIYASAHIGHAWYVWTISNNILHSSLVQLTDWRFSGVMSTLTWYGG